MSRNPRVTGAALIAALERVGFRVLRIKGSHHFLRHEDGRSTVVPVHSGETIGPGLLRGHRFAWRQSLPRPWGGKAVNSLEPRLVREERDGPWHPELNRGNSESTDDGRVQG